MTKKLYVFAPYARVNETGSKGQVLTFSTRHESPCK